MKRRTFIETAAGSALLTALPSTLFSQSRSNLNELLIPELYVGEEGEESGGTTYRLRVAAGQRSFLPQLTTSTYGINGDYLGPTFLIKQGTYVDINVTNEVDETTTLHWHGLHVPAAADGGPHQSIEPNQSWQADFEVKQAAGTFWYHSHMLGKTGEQVYRGLAGMIIIEDERSPQLG
ncbi:MAG: multicopper oxidase domain-containing protein, partial [Pseudomonadales bacterium]|nr:multicopper oxidase domain-containing protein [Pseudomonadales bacterium]